MMKHDIRSNALVKAVSVLIVVSLGVAAFFGWVYCGIHWDTLFDIGDYTYSAAYTQAMNGKYSRLMELLHYEKALSLGGTLSYTDQKAYEARREALEPSVTNFRYIVRDNATSKILYSTMGEDSLANVSDVQTSLWNWSPSYSGTDYDADTGLYTYYDDIGRAYTASEPPGSGPAEEKTELAVEYGVDRNLPVQDEFTAARDSFTKGDMDYLYLTCILTVAFLIFSVFLMCCAGRRRHADGFVLNWQDKIPYDLYLCLSAAALCGCGAIAVQSLESAIFYYGGEPYAGALYGTAGVALAAGFGLYAALLMTTSTRCKTRTLFRNTLIWRLCAWIGRGCGHLGGWWKTTFGSWDVTKRAVLWFLLYLAGTVLTGLTVFLIPFYQGAALYLLCRWVKEWKVIRIGTRAIVGGRPDTVIDTAGMQRFPDLAEHAEQLNDLGSAINSAVEERMKSERMKAELITNVSHDLKTPLTSIINYVDLLKKEDIPNEKAQEYIGVLDRKSQRLKKLTEDLVEASKASTGALNVERERLGVTQLVSQALGEYSEKLSAAGLTPVVTLPEEEVFVYADGRHFWRILDNLMGNCVKYAMPGTRVYLDVTAWDGRVTLLLKNISATQLNVAPEQLMERFVRGDESRTTEGSGLGLSIARSLTELQDGTFRVEVDGDLFKAVVSFPEMK